MKRITINVTDDSIGCEDRPSDIEIEIRDFRESNLRSAHEDDVRHVDGRPYVQYLFDKNVLEIY